MSTDVSTPDAPPPAILEAVKQVATGSTGKLHKVLFFDEQGKGLGSPPSTQVPEDPFSGKMERAGLQPPPFSLEQLVVLAEQHPIHSSCLEQKTVDTVGQGYAWEPDDPGTDENSATKDAVDAWMQSLATGEQSLEELITAAWDDKNTLGQGFLEVARDATGKVAQIFYVPGHTIRFHYDGIRIAQMRGQRTVWFKRWGAPAGLDVDMHRGTIVKQGSIPADEIANELLVFQKPSRRNSWYGIPGYVSAIGWISLALAARDDNLYFFTNRREPRWAVIMTNLEDNGDLDTTLQSMFTVDLKNPHRNIFVPVSGNGTIEFKQLSSDKMDGSFEKLSDRCNAEVLVAHRLPPERLGLIKVGNLGGNAALDASRVYKEAVVTPDQQLLKQRWNRFVQMEYARQGARTNAKVKPTKFGWTWVPVEMDLAEEEEDLRQATIAWNAGFITLDEARVKSHMPKLDPTKYDTPEADKEDGSTRTMGEMFVFELFMVGGMRDTPPEQAADETMPGAPGEAGGGAMRPQKQPSATVDPNTKKPVSKPVAKALGNHASRLVDLEGRLSEIEEHISE